MTTHLRWPVMIFALISGLGLCSHSPCQAAKSSKQSSSSVVSQPTPAGNFVDITESVGVHFQHQTLHTSRKYLLETMGSGVAPFDCDNDGRLDLFLVNGAPFKI